MFNSLTWFAIAVAIIAHTLAAIFFKTAAQQNSRKRIVWFFVIGNAVGFFNPFCTTLALRGNNPNVVIAVMGAVGGVFFVLTLNRVFHERLIPRQWIAIGIIIVGVIMLQQNTPRHAKKPKVEPASTSRTNQSLTRSMNS